MKKFFRYFIRTLRIILIVFFVFLASLIFREQKIPNAWVKLLADRCSTTNWIVQCDNMAFGFHRGLTVTGVRVYNREKTEFLKPVASVRLASIDPIRRSVRLDEFQFLRLHDGYYLPGGYQERAARLAIEFPRVPDFSLVLDRPNILGLEPQRVTSHVSVRPTYLAFDAIHIDWPNKTHQMCLDGLFRVDLEKQQAHGEVFGKSTTQQIRPLVATLDVPSALPYMDAFTEIPEPVPARGEFDVDLFNNDFRMRLDLRPTMGCYNGVPLARAEGVLKLHVFTRETNCNVRLDVDLPQAIDHDGQRLGGLVTMKMSNDLVRLSYDVKSELSFHDALKIADFIQPETLDVLTCETKPVITIKGRSGISVADLDYNNLLFQAQLARGSFMGLQLRDLETDFAIVGERIDFSRLKAKGKKGGLYRGHAGLTIPHYDENRMTFRTYLTCEKGDLEELADLGDFDLGEFSGTVDGWCDLSGPVITNFTSKLDAKGSVKITKGYLAQMKIFAGLTKILAEKVPGVSFLVNQTDASVDFKIKKGVFYTDNLYLEGGFFSIKGWGSYDFINDNLDFTVRVQFLKKESLLGTIVHPVTFPFTKLLLEFRATGSLEQPNWDYINLLERIL